MKTKIFGIGGCGNKIVDYLIREGVDSSLFVAINTDAGALKYNLSPKKMAIGLKFNRGLSAGRWVSIGRKASIESRDDILKELSGVELLIISAGMGGGAGGGAAPVIIADAEQLGIFTMAVVTAPFKFEGAKVREIAERSIAELYKSADISVIISNEKIFRQMQAEAKIAGEKCDTLTSFEKMDEVAGQVIKDILAKCKGGINSEKLSAYLFSGTPSAVIAVHLSKEGRLCVN